MTCLYWFLLENVLHTVFRKERGDILACIPHPTWEIPVSERATSAWLAVYIPCRSVKQMYDV